MQNYEAFLYHCEMGFAFRSATYIIKLMEASTYCTSFRKHSITSSSKLWWWILEGVAIFRHDHEGVDGKYSRIGYQAFWTRYFCGWHWKIWSLKWNLSSSTFWWHSTGRFTWTDTVVTSRALSSVKDKLQDRAIILHNRISKYLHLK